MAEEKKSIFPPGARFRLSSKARNIIEKYIKPGEDLKQLSDEKWEQILKELLGEDEYKKPIK